MADQLTEYYHVCGSNILVSYIDDYRVVLNVSVGYPEVDHLIKIEGLKNYHMVDGHLTLRAYDEPIKGELEVMKVLDYINTYPIRNGKPNQFSYVHTDITGYDAEK